jgi:hypothetical protein
VTANLPTVTEPIAGSLTASVNWRRWFQRVQKALQDGTLDTEALQADISAIATALGSPDGTVESIPGGYLSEDTNVIGPASVEVAGSLAGGAVVLQLTNDEVSPGATYYYGTDADGAKGFHALAPDQTFNRIDAAGDIRIGADGSLRITD